MMRLLILSYAALYIYKIRAQATSPSTSPTTLQNCKTDLLLPSYFSGFNQGNSDSFDNYWKSTGAPECAYDFGHIGCEALNSSLAACENAANPQGCFCLAVAHTPCPDLCRHRSEPPQYTRWILDHYCFGPHLATTATCKNSDLQPDNHPSLFQPPLEITKEAYKSIWTDLDSLQIASHSSLFAWNWRISYNNTGMQNSTTAYKCPSKTAQLGSFAVVNAITFLASVILGHRRVVKYLTCKMCGNRESSKLWWPLSGVVAAAFSIGGNAVNAALIKHSTGFSQVPATNLVLLWCARPRLAWLGALLGTIGSDNEYYTSLGASCTIAEGILQTIASFYIGRTAHWGAMLGYLQKGHLDGIPGRNDAAMMYAGALLWLVTVGLMFLIWGALTIRSMFFSKDVDPDESIFFGIVFCVSMVLPLIGQWLFWAGFIGLAGDRYCPPKLIHLTAVWSTSAVFGVLVGSPP